MVEDLEKRLLGLMRRGFFFHRPWRACSKRVLEDESRVVIYSDGEGLIW